MSRKAALRRRTTRAPTDLESRFIAEYLVDLRAGPALRRAGSKAQYPDQQAYEMLGKPHIAAEVQKRVAAMNEKCEVNRSWVLTELALQYRAADTAARAPTGGKRNVAEARLALSALEVIGKHVDVNAFRNQIGIGNPDGSAFNYDALDERELDDLERLLLKAATGEADARGLEGGEGPTAH
jgi:phage terminase small subunit